MTLKTKKKHLVPETNSKQGTAPAIRTKGLSGRILVQHNEETIREIACSMLTSAGYECRCATSPMEAWDILSSWEAVELLVCKVMEPPEDKLIERMVEQFPDIPSLILTTWQNISAALVAVRNGAYDYVLMPFETEQLLALVRRVLEYRRLGLENGDYRKKFGALTTPTTHKPERILVQDDEEPMREIVSSMLVASHYECRAVASPAEVLDILSSGEQFDLLLCGLLETGEDFFKRMSKQFPNIPLVVLSACHDVRPFLSALRDGAYDYCIKPFEREMLIFAVRRALEYRRLKLENREYKVRLERLAKRKSAVSRA